MTRRLIVNSGLGGTKSPTSRGAQCHPEPLLATVGSFASKLRASLALSAFALASPVSKEQVPSSRHLQGFPPPTRSSARSPSTSAPAIAVPRFDLAVALSVAQPYSTPRKTKRTVSESRLEHSPIPVFRRRAIPSTIAGA